MIIEARHTGSDYVCVGRPRMATGTCGHGVQATFNVNKVVVCHQADSDINGIIAASNEADGLLSE